MAKSFYGVRKGNHIGIFSSWTDCQKAILGFSGAEFKGFNTREEAEAYIYGDETALNIETGIRSVIKKPISDDVVNIYTDGSFKDGLVACGISIESNKKTWNFYGVVQCPEFANLRNIAGELLAVLIGVQIANALGFKRYNIIYDYEGVEAWYNGRWQAKGELQAKYVTLMAQFRLQNNLAFKFFQVKGHSGVSGNVMADKMATRAINMMTYINLDEILRGTLKVEKVPLYNII